MEVFLHHVETLVPARSYSQEFARRRMKGWLRDRRLQRLADSVYRQSGIERRHSVVDDFSEECAGTLFPTTPEGQLVEPSTGARNRCFIRHSREMSVDLARRAIERSGFGKEEITHVITASCTGFHNPGPDFHIVREAGLPDATERYHLGFMGCYAAFPALRMASQFCLANPRAVVLVECLELCSLHLQIKDDVDSLLANALFADGAGAALVSAQRPRRCRPVLALEQFLSAMAPEGGKDMAWEIGDRGFHLVLSSYVPDVIAANITTMVEHALAGSPWAVHDIAWWAVHPGGKAILDNVQQQLGLRPDQLQASREVLRDYGNMSSATIFFVLEKLLQREVPAEEAVVAMAFGPGLTVESALLRLCPVTAANVGEAVRVDTRVGES